MATIIPINVGSAPNDGTGDPLRTAMQTCNTNFANLNAEIYPHNPVRLIGTSTANTYPTVAGLIIVGSIFVPVNTLSASGSFEFECQIHNQIATVTPTSIKAWVNSTLNLSGATQIATMTNGVGERHIIFDRTYARLGNQLFGTSTTNDLASSRTANSFVPNGVNFGATSTSGFYLMIAITTTGSDRMKCSILKATT
jgi:hypothetical protein